MLAAVAGPLSPSGSGQKAGSIVTGSPTGIGELVTSWILRAPSL